MGRKLVKIFIVTNCAVVGIQVLSVALSQSNKYCFFQFFGLPVVFSNTTQCFQVLLSVLLPSKMGSLGSSFLLAGDLKILCRLLLGIGWYLYWLDVESLTFDLSLNCIQHSKQVFHCLLLGLSPKKHRPI